MTLRWYDYHLSAKSLARLYGQYLFSNVKILFHSGETECMFVNPFLSPLILFHHCETGCKVRIWILKWKGTGIGKGKILYKPQGSIIIKSMRLFSKQRACHSQYIICSLGEKETIDESIVDIIQEPRFKAVFGVHMMPQRCKWGSVLRLFRSHYFPVLSPLFLAPKLRVHDC